MGSAVPSVFLVLLLAYSSSIDAASFDENGETTSVGRRVLLSFKEIPRGTNVTFECSPSGPCLPCLYSEKGDDKFRCSETGYRIPFKCVEITDGLQSSNGQKTPKGRSTLETAKSQVQPLDDEELLATSVKLRNLLDNSSASKEGSQAYITYRSCVPAVNEEKLSVIGFESIVLGLLLISGTVVYIRRKRIIPVPGVATGRAQSNSRF